MDQDNNLELIVILMSVCTLATYLLMWQESYFVIIPVVATIIFLFISGGKNE